MNRQSLITLPSERSSHLDPTGTRVTQWTSFAAMHHHFYFTNPTLSRDGRRLFGVTYRNRYPNIFSIDTDSGEIRIITMVDDLNPFSPAPDKAGERIYFSARDEVRVVDVATGKLDVLVQFNGGKLGNCALSHDDQWLAISVREKNCRLELIELSTGKHRTLVEKPEVGHIQFNPRDPSLLEYSGPGGARIWTIRADGSDDCNVHVQRADEWVVHESWSADGEEIIFTHWPHALRALNVKTHKVRTIASVNAWHAWSSPDNRTVVCDTNHPDRGLLLIDRRSGDFRTLCHPNATCQGTQWRERLPAGGAGIDTSIIRGDDPASDPAPAPDSPPSVYGPQWTHPHPTFSADGKTVVFTSDRAETGGWSQIYSVDSAK